MLTIRLERVGKKNRAQFKIVLQEKRIAPGGAHVEILGSYDPHTKSTLLKEDRIKHWLSQGAQPSDTAHNLFVSKGIMAGAKIKVKMPAKKVEPSVTEVVADKEVAAEIPVTKPEEVKAEKAETTETKAGASVAEVKKVEEKKEVVAEAPKEEVKPEPSDAKAVEDKETSRSEQA